MNKIIIFSAPSGSGKSTIISHLLEVIPGLEFSISATSRAPRGKEQDGREYYFFSREEFEKRAEVGEFLEWEEVYPGCFYGTLRSEIERIWAKGHTVLFDIDVVGGMNLKQKYQAQALSLFIQPPSIEILRSRLECRGTDSAEKIEERLAKAAYEMSFADRFDAVVVNDDLQQALAETENKVKQFLELK